jgi:NAD(P)-dependent dehydrogenase (short-subunit alcohol dehydrogenase family)
MGIAIVTGAGRGLGLALVRALRARGDDVVATCRAPSPALAETGARCVVGVDVASAAGVSTLLAALDGATVDLLVHNAGLFASRGLAELDFDAMLAEYAVNALGPLRVTRALLPNLRRGACIGIITSQAGSIGDNRSGGVYGYRMSKAALNMAGVSLARDLRDRGVLVQMIHPGAVRTDMLTLAMGEVGHMVQHAVSPEEAAAEVLARLDELTPERSGTFINRLGQPLPW